MFNFLKNDENRARSKGPKSRLTRLEALEDRSLLTVSPFGADDAAVFAEFATDANDVAPIDLTTVSSSEFSAANAVEDDGLKYVLEDGDGAETTISTTPSDDASPFVTQNVQYLDADGKLKTTGEGETVTLVRANYSNCDWQDGWYYVDQDVKIDGSQIRCVGDVHLILKDGCTLTVTGANERCGIEIAEITSGLFCSLTVYGQQNQTGLLKATGGYKGAGIGGGGKILSAGAFTMNSGRVEAQGGRYAAGIGGSYGAAGANITINGGDVKATGGEKGAGIGGGGSRWVVVFNAGDGANITINGGRVEAQGGDRAAGIGGGGDRDGASATRGGNALDITIAGGYVKATGGDKGAGIGGGRWGSARNIEISGGEVHAFGKNGGAGIGGGQNYANTGSTFETVDNIVISGGTVEAQGGDYAAGIGGGERQSADTIKITGGTVTATGGKKAAGIGGGNLYDGAHITISGGVVRATGGEKGAGIGGGNDGKTENVEITGGEVYAVGKEGGAGIGGGNNYGHRGGSFGPVKNIKISGGYVEARAEGKGGAGIGGGERQSADTIEITGGTVKATGAESAAGIGGGSCYEGVNITIRGGYVEARGGEKGAGIGGGGASNGWIGTKNGSHGKNIKIEGGTVYAYGGKRAAGIGGGGSWPVLGSDGGNGENITISGGYVEAYGGRDDDKSGAGIGGGYDDGKGINIRIDGGTVIARASGRKLQTIGGQGSGRDDSSVYVSQNLLVNGKTPDSGNIASSLVGNVDIKPKTPKTEQVSYVDESGKTATVTATVVDESMRGRWAAGYYVVDRNVTIPNANVWTDHDVVLILKDNCALTVTGTSDKAGIEAVNGSLYVFQEANSKGTGTLIAVGGDSGGAGIGGRYACSNNPIKVYGGTVVAVGGEGAAGIGGGGGRVGGRFAYYGGTIVAVGGEGADGIGAGNAAQAVGVRIVGDAAVKAGSSSEDAKILVNSGEDWTKTLHGMRYVEIKSRAALETPTNFAAESTTDSISVSWDEVENAVGYSLQYKASGTDNWTNVDLTEETATEATVDDLESGKAYDFRVKALAESGGERVDSNYATLTASTQKDSTCKLAEPTGFKAVETTDGSITLSWNEVENASGYWFAYGATDESDWDWTVVDASETTATFDNLKRNAEYAFRVVAFSASPNYAASESAETSFKTAKTALTSVSISGTFEVGYTLTAKVAKGETAKYAWYREGDANPIATGAKYEVQEADVDRVLTVVATGTGDYAGTVSASPKTVPAPTVKLDAPTGFQAVATTDDSITVSWNGVENASGYRLLYKAVGDSAWSRVDGTQTKTIVDGLESDTKYAFRVQAVGDFPYADSDCASLTAKTDKAREEAFADAFAEDFADGEFDEFDFADFDDELDEFVF